MRTRIVINTHCALIISTAICFALVSCVSPSEPLVIVPGDTTSSLQATQAKYEVEMHKLSGLSQQLQNCAVTYAHPRVHSKLTGTELADASLSECSGYAQQIERTAAYAYSLSPANRASIDDTDAFGKRIRATAEKTARDAVLRDIADNT